MIPTNSPLPTTPEQAAATPAISAVVAAAVRTAVSLIGQFNDKAAVPADTARLFDQLLASDGQTGELTALPVDENEAGFLTNVVADCRNLCAGGKYLTARGRMVMLVRRLKTFRDRWQRHAKGFPLKRRTV